MAKFATRFCLYLSLLVIGLPAFAGDSVVGKDKAQRQCAECHRPGDWNGETAATLEALLNDIAAGKIIHARRELHLSAEDIADIVAYWTSAQKTKKN
jgi:mono/diheme cytochrome c family protein